MYKISWWYSKQFKSALLSFGNIVIHYQNYHEIINVYPTMGASGSMRACHAAGPGSIPGRDRFPGWVFFGVFPHLLDKCQEALGPEGPRISFGHHYHPSSFITGANDLRCWRALKPQIYIHTYIPTMHSTLLRLWRAEVGRTGQMCTWRQGHALR